MGYGKTGYQNSLLPIASCLLPKLGAMVLGIPRAANPLARSNKPGGGSIPLAPSNKSRQ